MANIPELGLGASALRAWLETRKDAGLEHTAAWLAGEAKVTPSTVHEWLTAGWLEGGAVPKALLRKRLAALSDGAVPEATFDADDDRRDRWKEAGKPTPRAAAWAPFAAELPGTSP